MLNNGVYATTGGQETPASANSSLPDMAKSAGYASSYEFADLEEFTVQAAQIFREDGPVLISVKTVPNVRQPDTGTPSTTPTEPHLPQIPDVIATLKRSLSG